MSASTMSLLPKGPESRRHSWKLQINKNQFFVSRLCEVEMSNSRFLYMHPFHPSLTSKILGFRNHARPLLRDGRLLRRDR